MKSLYSLYLEARMPKSTWQEMENLYNDLYDLSENGRYLEVVRVMESKYSTAAQDYNRKKQALIEPDQIEEVPHWEEVLRVYPVPKGWKKISRKEELTYIGYSSTSQNSTAENLAEKIRNRFPQLSVYPETYRINKPEISLTNWLVTIKTSPNYFSSELKNLAKKYPSWNYKRGIFSKRLG